MTNKGLKHIELSNNETKHKLKDIIKVTMSIIVKIDSENINGEIDLLSFLERFGIATFNLNFAEEEIKLSHLMHVYEAIEKTEFTNLLENDVHVNPLCREPLSKDQV